MPKYPRYQDYVIRDGCFVGEFEEMYRDFDDPWHQTTEERGCSTKAVALNLIERLGARRVVELGCGLGDYTARIAALGVDAIGLDISPTAMAKARARHPSVRFETASIEDFDVVRALEPDVIVMAEVTWYVLPHLRLFLDRLYYSLPNIRLIHLLTTYPPGVQKYGEDYFTDLDSIKQFFGMRYLESGIVHHLNGEARTWFLGEWPERSSAG